MSLHQLLVVVVEKFVEAIERKLAGRFAADLLKQTSAIDLLRAVEAVPTLDDDGCGSLPEPCKSVRRRLAEIVARFIGQAIEQRGGRGIKAQMASHFSQMQAAPFVSQRRQPVADGLSDRLLLKVAQTLRQLLEVAAFGYIQAEQIKCLLEG